MTTLPDSQLSFELQDMYLQNKQWLSDVLFLEEEAHFFRKLLDQFFSAIIKGDYLEQVQHINAHLSELGSRRTHLKKLVERHRKLLESILKDPGKSIGVELVEENATIMNEIKALFISDASVKKELYGMIENLMEKEKAGHLLKK